MRATDGCHGASTSMPRIAFCMKLSAAETAARFAPARAADVLPGRSAGLLPQSSAKLTPDRRLRFSPQCSQWRTSAGSDEFDIVRFGSLVHFERERCERHEALSHCISVRCSALPLE